MSDLDLEKIFEELYDENDLHKINITIAFYRLIKGNENEVK